MTDCLPTKIHPEVLLALAFELGVPRHRWKRWALMETRRKIWRSCRHVRQSVG